MNAPVSIPILTLDELIRRAINDHDAVLDISHIEHLTKEDEERIAARAVATAIDHWEFETGAEGPYVTSPLATMAYLRVLQIGRQAREDAAQLDMFDNHPLTDGAARYEARKELG